ncbi:hypothetical protein J3F83DRAFT_732464, partial [Trichoderma novae-zelandiae]
MSQRQTPSQEVLPRSRASSGSLSSSPSSSSSSYEEISRQYPTSRFGGFFSTFVKAPSERRRQRRRGSGTKKRRGVFFAGGSNSSHSSINSDLAYGTGFVKKEKTRSTRYSSSVAGSAASSSHPQPQQLPYSQYSAALPNRPSPRLPNEGKRDTTDQEIIAIGRQLSDLARRSNEEDLRLAGKTRPSGLASTAAAISALRKSRKEAKKRGLGGSKKHRDSSSDESDWESATDDDGDSSETSSSDESALHLAYGGNETSRSNVALSGSDTHLAYGGDSSLSDVALPVFMGAAAGVAATSVANSNPTHSRKSSVVDPRLFGPVNSLRGLLKSPCGFGDAPSPSPSTGSGVGPHLYDNDRPATGGSQADSARRPGPVPLQQPIPKAPVSNKVFEAGRRDSRNSYRRQQSNSGSLDPTLGGGVAAAAAAAAARMADQRGTWTEDRIYRDNVRLTRPDPDEDHFQRDLAPFEELERRRANPEVYYNRRDDDVDSPRMESNRDMPDYYGKDSPGLTRESRTWMELHPEERKESLKYQTTYDAHMRETEMHQAQERSDRLRDAQRQQQLPQQTARATKAGDRNADKPAQPAPRPNVDPFQYQVADDAFGTPQFNSPRRPLTPEIVTVDRVPNFTDSRSVPASVPSPSPPMLARPRNADIRLSRKDSHELEKAAEERQRGVQTEFRGRDPRAGYEYEQEEREARSILDEAKHSTIPVAAVAIASAIAVEEERSRERKRREYSDDGSRDRSRPQKDAVQEDADRYYRESVIARKIASDEIQSRSRSPVESVVDKWEKPSAEESFAIVSPPSMEDREHDDDGNPYAPPNADVKVDNEIYPHETGRFRAANGVDVSRFRARESSRERPLLNIVRPTPVPSPDPTSVAGEALKQPAEVPASRELAKAPIESSEDEESDDSKGEVAHSSPSGKSVSWGENSTKRFIVESPEARSRAESPNEPAEAEEKPRPRLSKISQWGKIAAMMAAGTAEPTTELDRHTASRSGRLPADDGVVDNDAPPVPGPKPVSPEPEQMPGTYADDLEFAATVAAGLKESGFDPNIVIDDPAFRRRDSRPGTNENPVMGRVVPEPPAEEPVSVPSKGEVRRDESQDDPARSGEREDEEELSLTDTEDEEDEKTQKQRKLDALEKYLQMRRSGEITPPSPPQDKPAERPTVQDRPVTPPPRGNERRNLLENFLQRRQSGEIQPPREVLEAAESRILEPVPEVQGEATEPAARHESDAQQPPARTPEPEALADADDSASEVASANKSKKKKSKKKKRRDHLDEASTVSSRLGDDRSRLSIPGDEDTELSRVSAPGDEASDLRTVYSVEDWEDWDSSPRSTRKSLVASELSTASRRSTRSKRRGGTVRGRRESGGNEPPPYPGGDDNEERGARPESRDDERKPRNREARHYQDNDNSEKPVSSRKRKDSGRKSNFFSGIFKSGSKNSGTINEKGDSFFEQAGTLGAGAGLASIAAAAARALTRSNAADVSSDPENISRDLPGSSREDGDEEEEEDHYPVIAPRAIAIDPQYGDLLPLPPSLPGTPLEASFNELPGLPDSRPGTPVEDRSRRFEKSHRRQRSNQENSLSNPRNRSHSTTAVPLALLRGIGSSPSSPVSYRTSRTPPRPTSWDSTKEFMPLMLLEHARRGSSDRSVKGEELPPLAPSEATSEAEGRTVSDEEQHRGHKLLPVLRAEDFRSPLPPNDGFNLADRSLRLQTRIPTMDHVVTDEESQGSTPKADVTYELPVQPTDNTLGEAAAGYDYRVPGPRTVGNDRPLTDNHDEPVPVESTPSSGQSARTVDAQAIPRPPTPTRRFLSPRQDIVRHHSDDLTSPDERSDAFETAHTSPAALHGDDLYEPDLPPIEPSMLGAIPEFSRPAKFFEDKVPEHPDLASVDKVIETLPSNESVPKDQARQGSPGYTDTLQESAEGSFGEGKKRGDWMENMSLSSEAEWDRDFSAQPAADETSAAFIGIPESAIDKDHTLDTEYISSTEPISKEVLPPQALEPTRDVDIISPEEHTWVEERKAQPVMVEDGSESEPEPERYAPGPELEWKSEPATVFEPLDEVVEAPSNEAFVDIVPVSDGVLSDVMAEPSQRSVPEEIEEEIIIGTLPAATRKIAEAAAEPILEDTTADKEPEPVQRDAGFSGEEYPRKPEVSTVIEDSEESDEEEDEEDEEDGSEDSEDSEDSEESDEEEEEERAKHTTVAGVAKREGEEEHAVRDMTASIETLGAVSVVSTSSKKSKKKKKKKKKGKRKKKKSKSAAAATAPVTSHDAPVQHAPESTEPAALPVVEPATKPTSDAAEVLPTDFEKNEGEFIADASFQTSPDGAVEMVEANPVDLPQDFAAPEPAPEASGQLTRDIGQEHSGEEARDAVTSPAPTPHEDLELTPEHTMGLADTEMPQAIPPVVVQETGNDELQKWAATDSEPIPHADRVGDDKTEVISPALGDEQDGGKRSLQVEDETVATEEKPDVLAPTQEDSPLQEQLPFPKESPLREDVSAPTTVDTPANVPAKQEDSVSPVQDREALVTDELVPTAEEMLTESPAVVEELFDSEIKDSPASDLYEQAPVPSEQSPSADRQLAAVEEDEQHNPEETVTEPEYEETTQLPTIMEEPAIEDAAATDGEKFVPSKVDQHAPVFNEQLSPILEELMEDLLEEAASAEKSKETTQEDSESKPGRQADESAWSIGQSEDHLQHQGAEENRVLESIAEEPEDDNDTLEPTLDEGAPRSIEQTAGGKDADWAPAQLPSFASEVSEPLFSQGDAPSEYPTQQYPVSAEPTQMGESFAVPEEPLRPPPPVPDAAYETISKAAELEFSVPVEPALDAGSEYPTQHDPVSVGQTETGEGFAVPEEPLRSPPPVPHAAHETISNATEDESSVPVEPTVDAPSESPTQHYPVSAGPTEMGEGFAVPEEPLRPPPPVPNAANETSPKATEDEFSVLTEPIVDAPALDESDKLEATTPAATDTADNVPSAEEHEQTDEHFSTEAPDYNLQEPEPKEVDLPEEGDKNEERHESPVADVEPAKQEHESERNHDEFVEQSPLEARPQTPTEPLTEEGEPSLSDEGLKMEEQQPAMDTVADNDTAPRADFSGESPEESHPAATDSAPQTESEITPLPASEEKPKVHDDAAMEPPSSPDLDQDGVPREGQTAVDSSPVEQREEANEAKRDESEFQPESESIPPQEINRELDLESKPEQEVTDDELKMPTDDTDLKTEDSDEKPREVDVDATEFDAHRETGPPVEPPPTHEEEHAPEKENNDNVNVTLDTEKTDENAEAPGQSVEADPADTLDPSVETSLPEVSKMTPGLDQSTVQEAELIASPVMPADADEKVEPERPLQPEDFEQTDLSQDGATAPVGATPQETSEDSERAADAEDASTEVDQLQIEDAPAPEGAQTLSETEIVEPAKEPQESAVAEGSEETETTKDDSINTTLPILDPVMDTYDGSHLDSDPIVVDGARSEPTYAPESAIPETTLEATPIAEDKEVALDDSVEQGTSDGQTGQDLQPEVPDTVTDSIAEPQPESKPEELPLEQATEEFQQNQKPDEPQEEPNSDEPEPESAVEEAGKELGSGLEETQVAPKPEESQQEPTSETQEEPILEEHKLEGPHLEEAVIDPAEQKDEAQYPATAEETTDPRPLEPTEQESSVPVVQAEEVEASREHGTDAPTSDTAQPDVQPAELDTVSEPQAVERPHGDFSDEPSMPGTTVVAESKVPVDSAAASSEQLPPAEELRLRTEEPSSTEPRDQREPQSASPIENSEEASQILADKPRGSFEPADSDARQPKPVEARSNSVRSTSIHLTVPGQEEDSGSEYDSDDDYDASSVASDMSYQREMGRSGSLGPNDSTTRLTGFEVVASPRVEGHAHRDRHKRKKKKGKKGSKNKHKRKKSRGGSEPSSSVTSLSESVPTTSNPSLGGSVPSLVVEPAVDQPEVPGQLGTGSRELEAGSTVTQPDNANSSRARTADDLFSEFADEPELLPSEQDTLIERAAASPELETIPEEAIGGEPEKLHLQEPGEPRDNEAADISHAPEESHNTELKPANEPESNDREAPTTEAPQEQTASAPLEEDSENRWDMFTGNWGKSSGKKPESGLMESPVITRDSTRLPEHADGSPVHIIQDAPLVEEPSEISTPRRNSQTEEQMTADIPGNAAGDERAGSQVRSEKRASSVPGSQSPKKSSRPSSQGGEKSDRWFGSLSGGISLFSERFGSPRKKKAKERDKDSIGADDNEDSKEESFLGNPALRQSGDERSWESNQQDREDMIDDFLHGGGLPTTPKRRRKRHDPSNAPTTPKRSESIVEARDDEGQTVRKVERGGLFGGDLVESPVLEATEPLGPFELLRRHSQVEDPIGGLLRGASEISLLPPMDMMSEISDYELSDYRLSPPRGLPAVEEQPEAEAEATASEVGFYRDGGLSGSPPPHNRSRRHSTSTILLEEDEEKQRDSGVDADWIEAAMAQLKTPEPVNRTPERQPQRRLRRSTLGGQRLRDAASLREAAQDPDRKTIPGTRERVLTGTGTRPETPTGRSSPTRKGYGAIAGMGIAARLASGRASPMTASSERSDTLPALRRSVTSPVAAPLRSLRRAVSAQIGPGLQRPASPSLALMPVVTEQPRSVSDSHIPSATRHQARADPGRGTRTPNSGGARPRTPERLKSSGGSTVRSSSNPSPPLLRRAERRMSLRQPNFSFTSDDHGGFDSSTSAPLATTNPNPSSTSIPTISPIPTPSIAGSIADSIAGILDPSPIPASSASSCSPSKPAAKAPSKPASSEPPVANEGRVRAKDKPDVY